MVDFKKLKKENITKKLFRYTYRLKHGCDFSKKKRLCEKVDDLTKRASLEYEINF